jgi:hypothetical protein
MGLVLPDQIPPGHVLAPSEQHRPLPIPRDAPGLVAAALNGDNDAPIG